MQRPSRIAGAALLFACAQACAGPVHDIDLFTSTLPTWLDDTSSGSVSLPFKIRYGQATLSTVNVNSEGLLSWGAFTSDLPDFPLQPVIAPFYANVDTCGGGVVRYGSAALGGRSVFGAVWHDVAGHGQPAELRNTFQVLLFDRSDRAPGDFDIEFNYDTLAWDDAAPGAPGARAGWQTRDWTGAAYETRRFELPGSGVAGALLDGDGPTSLTHHRLGSDVDGRYVFEVRSGTPVAAPTPASSVPEPSAAWLALTALGSMGLARCRTGRPS